jgi:hypothetical protein
MRDGEWKLVRSTRASRERITAVDDSSLPGFDLGRRPAPLPFNLRDDPFKQVDLAAQQPDCVARMTAAIELWFEDVTSRP